MKSNKIQKSAAAGLLSLGLFSSAFAADIDVVGTQTTFNPTYGLKTLSGNTTWTADNVYILTDRVYVPKNVTLTIEPGTKIYSTFDDKGTTTGTTATNDDTVGVLIIARGGKIMAQGTASAPIVFDALQTLEAKRGVDLPYDPDNIVGPMPDVTTTALWGGVIILGNASISLVDASQQPVRNDIIEGFTPAAAVDADNDGFSDILEYGFDNPANGGFAQNNASNSGVLSYVSIRHGGYNFAADNEINGLTLGGVGSGTKSTTSKLLRTRTMASSSSAERSTPAIWSLPSVRTTPSISTKATPEHTSSGSRSRTRAEVTTSASGTVLIRTWQTSRRKPQRTLLHPTRRFGTPPPRPRFDRFYQHGCCQGQRPVLGRQLQRRSPQQYPA